MQVVYAIDQAFENLAAVSLTSLLIHNDSIEVHVFVPDQHDYCRLVHITRFFQSSLTLHRIPRQSPIYQLPRDVQPYFLCLAAFDSLSNLDENVLYLDADTLCIDTILELTTLRLDQDVPFAACSHARPMLERSLALNLPSPYHYFNAGVYLFNPKKVSLIVNTSRVVNAFFSFSPLLRFREQCLLNIILNGHTMLLPNSYNLLGWMRSRNAHHVWHQPHFNLLAQDIEHYRSSAKIIHFSAGTVPTNLRHDQYDLYDHYWTYVSSAKLHHSNPPKKFSTYIYSNPNTSLA